MGIIGNTELQYPNMDNIHTKKVNTILITIYQSDTINIIKQKICYELLKLIQYENDTKNTDTIKKTCIYCFNNHNNEIISVSDEINDENGDNDDFLFEDEDDYYNLDSESYTIKCATCKKQYIYRSGLNLSKLKTNKLYLEQPLPIPEFLYLWKDDIICGHSICNNKKPQDFYICKNLKQDIENDDNAYNYIDIYNFLNKKETFENIEKKKENDYKNLTEYMSTLTSRRNNDIGKYINNILHIEINNEEKNIQALLKLENDIKNNSNTEKTLLNMRSKRYQLLNSIYINDNIIDKNRLDINSTLSKFIDDNTHEIEINMAYFPDFFLYYNYLISSQNIGKIINKDSIKKSLIILSKLYWPYTNFAKFNNFFIKNEMTYLYSDIKRWIFEIKNYNEIIEQFKNINISSVFKQKLELKQYTHKIYVEINGNSKDIIVPSYINLQKVVHLYNPTPDVPFLVMYLPKESKLLYKMTRTIKNKGIHRQLKWNIDEPNLIQFRMLIPKSVTNVNNEIINEDIYMQIQLYDTKVVRFTINLSSSAQIYIGEKQMKFIIKEINKFIKKLNSNNIGNLGIDMRDRKIKLADDDIQNWTSENSNVNIQSINGSIVIKKFIDFDDIKDKSIIQMLYPYLKLDNTGKGSILDFRFLRLEYGRGNEITQKKDIRVHKFVMNLYQQFINDTDDETDIRTELTLWEKDVIIESMQIEFNMTQSQAVIVYNFWEQNKDTLYGKAKGYGILYQLSKSTQVKRCTANRCSTDDILDETYQWCIMGFKSFEQWEYLSDFAKKMIYLIYSIKNIKDIKKTDNNYNIIKFFKTIYEHFYENVEIDNIDTNINKITGYTYLKRLKQAYDISIKCPNCGMKIKHTMKDCPFCKVKLDMSNRNLYAKRCSVNRQPIGTGDKVGKHAPKILTIKDHNLKNMKTNIAVNENTLKQVGGGETNINKLNNILEKKLLKIEQYKKKKKTKIDKEKYQLKIESLENIVVDLNYYISVNTRKLNPSRWLHDYDNQHEWEDKQIIRMLIELKIPINSIKKNFPSNRNKNNKFKEIILTVFTNKWGTVYRKRFIEFYGLEKAIQAINKRYPQKMIKIQVDKLIQYHVWRSNKFIKDSKGRNPPGWQKKECALIWDVINTEKTKKKTLDKIMLFTKIVKYFNNYEKTTLQYISKKELKEISTQIKDPLDYDSYNDKLAQILKPFENGNILEWEGKVIKCPNNPKSKKIYPGFLDLQFPKSSSSEIVEINDDDVRKNVCHPCCFANMNKKTKRNLLYCADIINKETHTNMIKLETKIDDYISTNNNRNLEHTFGKLPKILHKIFNHYTKFDKNFSANIMKSEGFVLMGINRCLKVKKTRTCFGQKISNDKSFWITILKYTELEFWELINIIRDYLKKNPEEFISLNQGKIYSKFKTILQRKTDIHIISINKIIDEYLSYIQITNDYEGNIPFDRKYLIDILSKPGIIHKDGLNIIIFKQIPHKLPDNNINLGKIYTSCLTDIFIEDYYDINKKFIFLYEYDDKTYEPIVLKRPKKKTELLKKIFSYDDKIYSELIKLIGDWNLKGCSKQYISRKVKRVFYKIKTCKQSIELFEKLSKYDKSLLPIAVCNDSFSRSIFILTQSYYIIPVKPSIYNFGKYPSIDISHIQKHIKNLSDTISYINKINTLLDKNNFSFNGYDINGVFIENSQIRYLVFESQLYIPVKSSSYKQIDNHQIILTKNNKKFNISDITVYNNQINNLIISGNEWDNFIDIESNIESQERYNRLILEFSIYINNDSQKKYKEEIINLIKKTQTEKNKYDIYKHHTISNIKQQLYDMVYKICQDITVNQKSEYIQNKKEKYITQVRKSCIERTEAKTNDNICSISDFCIRIGKDCKLVIPRNKMKLFVGMIISEMLRYGKKYYNKGIININVSGRILDNTVNQIVDMDLFEDYNQGVYERKTPTETLLNKIRLNKEI